MPAGRPRILKSPEQAQALGEAYFARCEEQEKPKTITGLALALGLWGRAELSDYQARPEFSSTIRRLKSIVEEGYECALFGTGAAGPIFALKNFGWTDKTEQEVTGTMTHKVIAWEGD